MIETAASNSTLNKLHIRKISTISALVVIPTYQEKENIVSLLNHIHKNIPEAEIYDFP